MITSKFLAKVLRNSIKYVVWRAFSGALKVALLGSIIIQSVFLQMKVKMNMQH